MNKAILETNVQCFILENLNSGPDKIALGKSPFPDVSAAELAAQIDSRKRSEKKLPLWFATPKIYYPSKLSIEQASSEATARYKANLTIGKTVLDLTGGFGVDSFYFSIAGKKVVHAELNEDLSEIARHNAEILNARETGFYHGNGFDLLNADQFYDTIYVDPSRRIESKKVFRLTDCQPNLPEHLDKLLAHCSRLLVKTSPLLDIQSGLKELKHVREIHVISVKNECKELLWVIEQTDLAVEPLIYCSALADNDTQQFNFKTSDENLADSDTFSNPLSYLYEPDVAVLKGGAFKLAGHRYGLNKLNANSHLYTSNRLKNDFLGRKFRVLQWGIYKSFMAGNNFKKANVISRNFPLSPEQIKKKHKIADGGDQFLIFTTGPHGALLTIYCERNA